MTQTQETQLVQEKRKVAADPRKRAVEEALRELSVDRRDLHRLCDKLLETNLGAESSEVGLALSDWLGRLDRSLENLGRQQLPAAAAFELASIVARFADLLSEAKSADDAKAALEGELNQLEEGKEKMFSEFFAEIRGLEAQLRAINTFFENAKASDGSQLAIDPELYVVDQNPAKEGVRTTLERFLDRKTNWHDMADTNVGILLIPGAFELAQRKELEKLALSKGMLLFSDIADHASLDDLMESLRELENRRQGLVRNEALASVSVVAAPYLMARERYGFERDDVWIPPSYALAGMVSRADRTRESGADVGPPPAGERNGVVTGVLRGRFGFSMTEVSRIGEKRINPIYRGLEKNMVVSSTDTLCPDDQYQQYQARRICDYVLKRANLIRGYELEISYKDELFNRGELAVRLAVQPTMVTHKIVVQMEKSLEKIKFPKPSGASGG